jgi:hypothetical protein
MKKWIYDIETYPNVFTIALERTDTDDKASFEISDRVNDSRKIAAFLNSNVALMIGFNNLGFDYPVLHMLLTMGVSDAKTLYNKAQAIIDSQSGGGYDFTHLIPSWKHMHPQMDLFKIHHFDNPSRKTSLKALQFAMRMDTLEDLPFDVGMTLSHEQIDVLKRYNAHDVHATKLFYQHTLPMIEFREKLSEKTGFNYTNHSDTAIGKKFFINALTEAGIQCYDENRKPRQTPRPFIDLKNCIASWIKFKHEGLEKIRLWLLDQTITETKSVFKDLSTVVKGTTVVFGLGGIHASIKNTAVRSDDNTLVIDLDVASYYPNVSIANNFYPEHMTHMFCDVYDELFEIRKRYPKGTADNAAYKLALNAVYGDSNNPRSPFFDPQFTMRVTLNGQLLLCKLIDLLLKIDSLQVIQMNTDGITVSIDKEDEERFGKIVDNWQTQLKFVMERTDYKAMWVRDVNNYMALSTSGKLKKKGAYAHEIEWHKDHGELIVPKVAELVLTQGKPIRKTVEEWQDPYDFLILGKVNRSDRLSLTQENDKEGEHEFIQRVSRYYVADGGKYMWKHMPSIMSKKGETGQRINAVKSGWRVHVCNDIKDFGKYAIDYDYYVEEVEKLCLILK